MRTLLIAVAALAVALALAGGARAQAGGTVTVVHGVPGLPVDVYVNGQRTLTNFQPGTVTDPLQLAAGDYLIEVRPAGAAADSPPAIAGSATLTEGANVSIVAHLDANGSPTLSVFPNDVSPIAAGQARVVARHTAAAPAVDVLVNGQAVFTNLTNPNEAKADVPAATISVAVAPARTTIAVLGPLNVTLQEGTVHILYAVGSLDQGTLQLLLQTISGVGVRPGVPAGSAGLAEPGGLPAWGVWLMLAAGAGAVASGAMLVRRRR